MESKRIIQSKNIWFNVLSIMAIVVAELSASSEIKELLGTNAFMLMIAGAIINMLIRFYTVKPITIGEPPPKLNPADEALRKEAENNGLV